MYSVSRGRLNGPGSGSTRTLMPRNEVPREVVEAAAASYSVPARVPSIPEPLYATAAPPAPQQPQQRISSIEVAVLVLLLVLIIMNAVLMGVVISQQQILRDYAR